MKNQTKLALALLALTSTTMLLNKAQFGPNFNDRRLPLGLRNNNPLNLIQTPIKWQGEIINPTKSRFESFATLAAGLRAGIRNAKTKYTRDKKTTIQSLVSVWAPAYENNTSSYVAAVAEKAGISPTTVFKWSDSSLVARIIHAMCIHENGAISDKYLPLSAVLTEVKAVG